MVMMVQIENYRCTFSTKVWSKLNPWFLRRRYMWDVSWRLTTDANWWQQLAYIGIKIRQPKNFQSLKCEEYQIDLSYFALKHELILSNTIQQAVTDVGWLHNLYILYIYFIYHKILGTWAVSRAWPKEVTQRQPRLADKGGPLVGGGGCQVIRNAWPWTIVGDVFGECHVSCT